MKSTTLVASMLLASLASLPACQKAEGCTVFARADGAAVISCGGDTDNAVTITQGKPGTDGTACTVSKSASFTTIACEDGTTITLPDAKDGEDGEDGSACTVVDNGDGTRTVSCTDGTAATFMDGAPGESGLPGATGHASLVDTAKILTSVCPGGGTIVRIGTDDGDGKGKPDDEELHPDEVDHEFVVWSGTCNILEIRRQASLSDTWSWGLLPIADLSEQGNICVGDYPKAGDPQTAQSRIWLELDISTVPDKFDSATLELAADDNDGVTGAITIHAASEPWTAGALNWFNEPDFEAATGSATSFATVYSAGDNGWVGFDLTDIVKAWVEDPSSNYGIVLRTESASWACFASSGTGLPDSLQPRLVYTGKPDPLIQE